MAIACEGLPFKLVKFPPMTTPAIFPLFIVKAHMVWMDASVETKETKSPLGSWPSSPSLPLLPDRCSVCPRNWYSEMPLKSPAMPTRPNCERSRFAGGAAEKLSASVGNGARREARKREVADNDVRRRRPRERCRKGIRIFVLVVAQRWRLGPILPVSWQLRPRKSRANSTEELTRSETHEGGELHVLTAMAKV